MSLAKPEKAFQDLCDTLTELGYTLSPKKLVPRATSVTYLGIEIDTMKYTISVSHEILIHIRQLCQNWAQK